MLQVAVAAPVAGVCLDAAADDDDADAGGGAGDQQARNVHHVLPQYEVAMATQQSPRAGSKLAHEGRQQDSERSKVSSAVKDLDPKTEFQSGEGRGRPLATTALVTKSFSYAQVLKTTFPRADSANGGSKLSSRSETPSDTSPQLSTCSPHGPQLSTCSPHGGSGGGAGGGPKGPSPTKKAVIPLSSSAASSPTASSGDVLMEGRSTVNTPLESVGEDKGNLQTTPTSHAPSLLQGAASKESMCVSDQQELTETSKKQKQEVLHPVPQQAPPTSAYPQTTTVMPRTSTQPPTSPLPPTTKPTVVAPPPSPLPARIPASPTSSSAIVTTSPATMVTASPPLPPLSPSSISSETNDIVGVVTASTTTTVEESITATTPPLLTVVASQGVTSQTGGGGAVVGGIPPPGLALPPHLSSVPERHLLQQRLLAAYRGPYNSMVPPSAPPPAAGLPLSIPLPHPLPAMPQSSLPVLDKGILEHQQQQQQSLQPARLAPPHGHLPHHPLPPPHGAMTTPSFTSPPQPALHSSLPPHHHPPPQQQQQPPLLSGQPPGTLTQQQLQEVVSFLQRQQQPPGIITQQQLQEVVALMQRQQQLKQNLLFQQQQQQQQQATAAILTAVAAAAAQKQHLDKLEQSQLILKQQQQQQRQLQPPLPLFTAPASKGDPLPVNYLLPNAPRMVTSHPSAHPPPPLFVRANTGYLPRPASLFPAAGAEQPLPATAKQQIQTTTEPSRPPVQHAAITTSSGATAGSVSADMPTPALQQQQQTAAERAGSTDSSANTSISAGSGSEQEQGSKSSLSIKATPFIPMSQATTSEAEQQAVRKLSTPANEETLYLTPPAQAQVTTYHSPVLYHPPPPSTNPLPLTVSSAPLLARLVAIQQQQQQQQQQSPSLQRKLHEGQAYQVIAPAEQVRGPSNLHRQLSGGDKRLQEGHRSKENTPYRLPGHPNVGDGMQTHVMDTPTRHVSTHKLYGRGSVAKVMGPPAGLRALPPQDVLKIVQQAPLGAPKRPLLPTPSHAPTAVNRLPPPSQHGWTARVAHPVPTPSSLAPQQLLYTEHQQPVQRTVPAAAAGYSSGPGLLGGVTSYP